MNQKANLLIILKQSQNLLTQNTADVNQPSSVT